MSKPTSMRKSCALNSIGAELSSWGSASAQKRSETVWHVTCRDIARFAVPCAAAIGAAVEADIAGAAGRQRTAVMLAKKNGRTEVVQLLKKAK